MKLAKKGWIIVVLAILISIIYLSSVSIISVNVNADTDSEDTEPQLLPFDCFVASAQDCMVAEAENLAAAEQLCKDNGGEISEDKCTLGCCCLWKPLFELFQAEIGYRKGSCMLNTENVFFSEDEIKGTTMCTQKCEVLSKIKKDTGTLPACSDGQDNDGDGLTDYCAAGDKDLCDLDCLSPDDNTEEPSATEKECNNTIDDDGDGLIDSYELYELGGDT